MKEVVKKEVIKLLDVIHQRLVYLYQTSYDFVEAQPPGQSQYLLSEYFAVHVGWPGD
jgi:hypothetical protein